MSGDRFEAVLQLAIRPMYEESLMPVLPRRAAWKEKTKYGDRDQCTREVESYVTVPPAHTRQVPLDEYVFSGLRWRSYGLRFH